jgi:hypothetical protein
VSQRFLVLKSPGYAGLGDLLLALQRALLVARTTDRRLVVDWRDTPYSRDNCNLADQLFVLQGVEALPPTVLVDDSGQVLPSSWQGRLDQPLRQVYSSLRSDNWNRAWASAELDAGLNALDSDAEWVILWDQGITGLQAASQRRLGIHEPPPLRQHLQLLTPLQEAINDFQRQHFCQSMIGIHLRASSEAVRAGKSATLQHMFQCLDQLLDAHPDSGMFLASDNAAAIAAMRARYPAVLTRPKWLPAADNPLHFTDNLEVSGIAIVRDALIDLALLASCDQLIHPARSSFSIAAARWSGLSSTRIHSILPPQSIQPNQWSWPNAGWINKEEMASIPAEELSYSEIFNITPSVSVIIMARNHASFLEQAIDSVRSQVFNEPIEILIGEDCSNDATLQVAKRLQIKHPSLIRVITADTNVGIQSNFLRLAYRARAPLIALLEGDNYWTHQDKLRLQCDLIRSHPEYALVAAKTANFIQWIPDSPEYDLPHLLRRDAVHTSTLLIRSDHLGSYPRFPDNIYWDTMLLGYLLARGSCGFLPVVMSSYRRHRGEPLHNADRIHRLEMSCECIDALDAFFYQRFRRELTSRELWSHRVDATLPAKHPWRHWRQSWRLQLSHAPRLLRRAPLGYVVLIARTTLQPLWFVLQRLRSRLALGSNWRRLRAEAQP